jgi:hypothetical protein
MTYMIEDKYFDGVGNIAVQGAVARVELTRVIGLNGEGGKAPAQEVDMRLVMPLDALLRMYQALGQIVGQMEEKGVVRKREAGDAAKAPPASVN